MADLLEERHQLLGRGGDGLIADLVDKLVVADLHRSLLELVA